VWAHSPEDATRLGLRRLSIKHRDNTITSVMDRKRKSKVIRSHTPTTIWPVPGILTVVHQWKVFSKDLHFQFLRRRCLFNAQPMPLKPWFHVQLLHTINYFRIWAGYRCQSPCVTSHQKLSSDEELLLSSAAASAATISLVAFSCERKRTAC